MPVGFHKEIEERKRDRSNLEGSQEACKRNKLAEPFACSIETFVRFLIDS
jgi:hypothetical protein